MKVYNICLFRKAKTTTDIAEGFLTLKEAKQYLHDLGFRWSESQQKWEQTYTNVDPYDELAVANVYTEASVVVNEIREDDDIDGQVA